MKGSDRRLNGIVVIDKPEGIASYDVVRRLKGLLSGERIGYLGTLDPLATGVLPVLLGEGTKLAPFLEAGRKVYEAELSLGKTTDTQDREGHVLHTVDLAAYDLSPSTIEAVIKHFRGRIQQLPPMYSALKQQGEPLYKLARRGEEAERDLREVEIYELKVTKVDPPSLGLSIECSKGTYIRTLGHDIGMALGCGAHVAALRRTRSGPFTIEAALALEEVEKLLRERRLKQHLIPLAQAMGFLPAIEVGEAHALQISNGQVIPVSGVPQVPSVAQQHPDNQFSIQKRAGHFDKKYKSGDVSPCSPTSQIEKVGIPQAADIPSIIRSNLKGRGPHSGRGPKEAQVVRVVAQKGRGLIAVGEIQQGAEGLVLRPLRVFHDAVFTKGPLYGKNKIPTMVDQGGR
jgi:tRNA pseudouridine55 synthase